MLAFVVSILLFGRQFHIVRDLIVAGASLPIWILLLKVYGLYDADAKRISHSTVDDLPWVFHTMVFGALGLWTIFRAGPLDRVNLWEFIAFVTVGSVVILGSRSVVRDVTRAMLGRERVLMVADRSLTDLLVRKMRGHPEYQLEAVGYLGDWGSAERGQPDDDVRCLGRAERLRALSAPLR